MRTALSENQVESAVTDRDSPRLRPRFFDAGHERQRVLREILRPRTGALTVSTLVAVFAWFQTDVGGLGRVVTVFATFALVYLVFNVTAATIEFVGQ